MILNGITYLFLISILQFTRGGVRIMFSRCSYGGFTCSTIGKNVAVYYQCPSGTDVSMKKNYKS